MVEPTRFKKNLLVKLDHFTKDWGEPSDSNDSRSNFSWFIQVAPQGNRTLCIGLKMKDFLSLPNSWYLSYKVGYRSPDRDFVFGIISGPYKWPYKYKWVSHGVKWLNPKFVEWHGTLNWWLWGPLCTFLKTNFNPMMLQTSDWIISPQQTLRFITPFSCNVNPAEVVIFQKAEFGCWIIQLKNKIAILWKQTLVGGFNPSEKY